MPEALPSILETKADFKTYIRNFHLVKNTQFGKRCKGDVYTKMYLLQKKPNQSLNWCYLITNSVHPEKPSDLQVFLHKKW